MTTESQELGLKSHPKDNMKIFHVNFNTKSLGIVLKTTSLNGSESTLSFVRQ